MTTPDPEPTFDVAIAVRGLGTGTYFHMSVTEDEYVGLRRAADRSQAVAKAHDDRAMIPTLEVTR